MKRQIRRRRREILLMMMKRVDDDHDEKGAGKPETRGRRIARPGLSKIGERHSR